MSAAARFSYQRLRHGVFAEESDEDRGFRRVPNFSRLRGFSISRRRLKIRIPGLRRLMSLRRTRRLLSRAKVSWSKALKRLKNGKAHMNDLFGGNYLVMQVSSAPFHQRPDYRSHSSHGLPASGYPLERLAQIP